jgi:hypothetical protein
MGLAWKIDDADGSVLGGSAQTWTPRRRHRRPTLLARGGQAVTGRFTVFAVADPGAGHPSGGPRALRRAALPGRRYWT